MVRSDELDGPEIAAHVVQFIRGEMADGPFHCVMAS